jgi:hypothetical protein
VDDPLILLLMFAVSSMLFVGVAGYIALAYGADASASS